MTMTPPTNTEGAVTDVRITVKLRLRDKHCCELNRQARAVNFVWNYCNETQRKAVGYRRKWLSGLDLQKLTSGSSESLALHSHTITRVCDEYYKARMNSKLPWLRWRGAKNLGWVPFNTNAVAFDGEGFIFRSRRYTAMHMRDGIAKGARLSAGSFNQDSRGRWYINVVVSVPASEASSTTAAGIDLGLKTLATLSDGSVIEMPRFYRASELALATAQRAKKTKRARAIHAKAANRRRDFQHKASKALCEKYGVIIVGDVSPSKLVKTKMAKSVHDAGWSGLKSMIRYKALMHGGTYLEVNEAYSTQTCSSCGSLPASRPKGITGLGMRGWECSDCGTVHDRDVNAARNILRIGLDTLAEGALRGRSRKGADKQTWRREQGVTAS